MIRHEDFVAIPETEDNAIALTFIDFYSQRPHNMEDMTLLEFAKRYSKGIKNRLIICRKHKIVQVYPKVDKNFNQSSFELFV